jgi:hypothetical protein
LFSAGAVASTICWTATGSFMVSGFMSSDRGYLGDPVVNPHEVGVFSELGGVPSWKGSESRYAMQHKLSSVRSAGMRSGQ